MSDAETRAYYEAEARLRLRSTPKSGLRAALHEQFHELLRAEGRRSVVDFGSGPGIEGTAFRAAGFRYVGIDLAIGNGRLGAEQGLHVVTGDVVAPPLRLGSFDAGWSMSVLMHLPTGPAREAAAACTAVLVEGAPFWIGLWGGTRGIRYDATIEGERRVFHHRSVQHNAELFGRVGDIEDIDLYHVGGGEYQVFRLRARGGPDR